MSVQFLDRSIALPATADAISRCLNGPHDEWHMSDAERCALSALLSALKPECAIEVGVYRAGSLNVLATHCKKVYALDIDAECERVYGPRFPNVEFITGPSSKTLPELIERLQASGQPLELVMIDGEHTEAGVRSDIESVLRYRPGRPLYVLMHDSFNPECRRAMRRASWAANPHVHTVELDFVVGRLAGPDFPGVYRQMWNGLALAILLPERRTGALTVHETEALMFEAAVRRSVYRYRTWWNPAFSVPRMARGVRSRLVAFGRGRAPALYATLRARRDKHAGA